MKGSKEDHWRGSNENTYVCEHSDTYIGIGLNGGVVRASGAGVINGGLLAAATAEEDASCLDKANITAFSLAAFAFASAVDDLVNSNEEVV